MFAQILKVQATLNKDETKTYIQLIREVSMSKYLREIWEMSLAWFVTFVIFGGLLVIAIPMTILLENNTPKTFIEEASGTESLVYIDHSSFDPNATNEEVITDPMGIENPHDDGSEVLEETEEIESQPETTIAEEKPQKPVQPKPTATETEQKSSTTKNEQKPSKKAKQKITQNKKRSSLKGKHKRRTRFISRSKNRKNFDPKTRTWATKGNGKHKKNKCIPTGTEDIQQIGKNKYLVSQSLVKPFLRNPLKANKLAKAVWLVDRDRKKIGVKLKKFGCKSPLYLLGLKRGDVILSVDGKRLNSTVKALSVYGKARSKSKLKVKVKRRNKIIHLNYKLNG